MGSFLRLLFGRSEKATTAAASATSSTTDATKDHAAFLLENAAAIEGLNIGDAEMSLNAVRNFVISSFAKPEERATVDVITDIWQRRQAENALTESLLVREGIAGAGRFFGLVERHAELGVAEKIFRDIVPYADSEDLTPLTSFGNHEQKLCSYMKIVLNNSALLPPALKSHALASIGKHFESLGTRDAETIKLKQNIDELARQNNAPSDYALKIEKRLSGLAVSTLNATIRRLGSQGDLDFVVYSSRERRKQEHTRVETKDALSYYT